MSKLRTDQLETLDGLHTKNVSDLLVDINEAQVTTSTGEQTLAEALDQRVIYVDTIADLRALTTSELVDGQQVQVKEYHSGTGVGGGLYHHDAGDTTSADNGGTVIVDAQSRRWKLAMTGSISVTQFGAVGDGVNDDTDAINACLTFAREGEHVFFPPPSAEYLTTNTLFIGRPMRVTGNHTRIKCNAGNGFDIQNEAAGTILEGFIMLGNRSAAGTHIGIRIAGDYTTVRDCEIAEFKQGFEVWAGVWHRIEKIRARNILNSVGVIGNVVGTVVEDFRYDTDTGTFAQPTQGGISLFGEGCNFSDLDIINAGPACLHIYTDGRESIWNFFNSCSFDTSERGVWISSLSSAHSVRGIMFDHCWISSHSEEAVFIEGAYNLSGVTFADCTMINNGKGAIRIAEASDEVLIQGCVFSSNSEDSTGTYDHIIHDTIGDVFVRDCSFSKWGQNTSINASCIRRNANKGYLLVDGNYGYDDANNAGLDLADTNGPVVIGNNYGVFSSEFRNTKQNILCFTADSGQTDGNGIATIAHNFGTLPHGAIAQMDPISGNYCAVTNVDANNVYVQVRQHGGTVVANNGSWIISLNVFGFPWGD